MQSRAVLKIVLTECLFCDISKQMFLLNQQKLSEIESPRNKSFFESNIYEAGIFLRSYIELLCQANLVFIYLKENLF